jgi:hypothetical protein
MNKKTNKRMTPWLLLVAAVLIVLAGCSNAKPPKEAVQTALTKSIEMKSYTFNGSLALDELSIPPELLQGQDPSMVDMIKKSSITVNGVYQADPMQLEMTMDVDLKGDLAFKLSVPMVMTQDKLWVKVPTIPGVPLGDLAGKFVEIDMKKLAEEQGVQVPNFNVNDQRKMTEDMSGIALKHFDEKEYFTELKAKDVPDLPQDLKPDQIVKFAVTQNNFEKTVLTVVDKVAPEIIDLLLNNEQYRNSLQLTKEELEKTKKDLSEGDRSELRKQIDEFKKDVKVNELSLISAIKDSFVVYQQGKANVDFTQDGQTVKVGLNVKGQYANINEKVAFKIGIPKDAVPMDQVSSMFMSPGM